MKLAEGILVDLGKSSDEVRGSEVVRWFTRRHHSTLEEAIKKAALSPVNREKMEPEELYQALLELARETAYVLLNKIVFYKVLERYYRRRGGQECFKAQLTSS